MPENICSEELTAENLTTKINKLLEQLNTLSGQVSDLCDQIEAEPHISNLFQVVHFLGSAKGKLLASKDSLGN